MGRNELVQRLFEKRLLDIVEQQGIIRTMSECSHRLGASWHTCLSYCEKLSAEGRLTLRRAGMRYEIETIKNEENLDDKFD